MSTLTEAAKLAEEYSLIHSKKVQKKLFHPTTKDRKPAETKPSQAGNGSSKAGSGQSGKSCAYCKRPGHLIDECKKLKAKEEYLKGTSESKGSAACKRYTPAPIVQDVVPDSFVVFL